MPVDVKAHMSDARSTVENIAVKLYLGCRYKKYCESAESRTTSQFDIERDGTMRAANSSARVPASDLGTVVPSGSGPMIT